MSIHNIALQKRWRGLVLELVYDGHRKQESRLDDLTLWGLMRDLGHGDVSQSDVITLLQDLRDRRYLRFNQEKNDYSGRITISQIEITPEGRDLVEKIRTSDAVRIL